MELIARGWPLMTAAREVGISRSAAYLWRDGGQVCDKDGSMRIVAPLEPASLRPISARFLSEEERIQIADLASEGHGPTAIGQRLGRSASTVSRELRRNRHVSGQYRPFHAHRQAAVRRFRPKPLRISTTPALRKYVGDKLASKWSPVQISLALRRDFPDDATMRLAPESIYLALYRPDSGLIVPKKPSPLRTGRDHRRAHSRISTAGRRFAQPMLSIHERGFPPEDRSQPGHWEGDLIVGPHNRSAIATLVERQTRSLALLKMETFTSAALYDALVAWSKTLPGSLRRTLTWDQGKEMSKHLDITATTGMRIYFCDRASPWQRGTNENTNGLLRQYFPKSTDLGRYSHSDLARVEQELNQRPRRALGDKTPAELFEALLASNTNTPVATTTGT